MLILNPGQVIILDQHGVVESLAMVGPSAASHGIFFQGSPAGGRLARIENRRFRARNRVHELLGQRRHPAQALKEVEQDALG